MAVSYGASESVRVNFRRFLKTDFLGAILSPVGCTDGLTFASGHVQTRS